MKKLVCSAFFVVAVLSQAAGCIFTSDDDDPPPPPPPEVGEIDVSWQLQSVGIIPPDEGVILDISCDSAEAVEVGVANVILYAQLGSASPVMFPFPCADGGAGIADLVPGTYQVWVGVVDANNETIAQSFSVDAVVTAGNTTTVPEFTVQVSNGFFQLTWQVFDGEGVETDCAGIPDQTGVSIAATPINDVQALADTILNCTDGTDGNIAITAPVPVGTSTVAVSMINAADEALSTTNTTGTITYGNEAVDLGNLELRYGVFPE